MEMFTIRDSKAEAYLSPFMAPTIAVAIRIISDTARDPKSLFFSHPEDYQLFKIGEFDEQTGIIKGVPHTPIGQLLDLVSSGLASPSIGGAGGAQEAGSK